MYNNTANYYSKCICNSASPVSRSNGERLYVPGLDKGATRDWGGGGGGGGGSSRPFLL